MSHTPGPWSIPHFARPESECECGYVLTEQYMGAVATVHCSGEGNVFLTGDNPKFDEAVANAHLIAAAPDLLDIAKRWAALGSGATETLMEDTKAAIIKAEGGEA